MNKDGRSTTLKNIIHILIGDFRLTLNNDLITLDGNNLTSILIDKVLIPRLHHVTSKLATNGSFQTFLTNLDLFTEVEDLKNVFIILKTNCTKQSGYRKFLLSVNVGIHHIVDIRSKFYPRTLERNDTGRIQHGTIGMNTLTKEHTRGTVQL